jgi:histidinol-phosphate aminotransferase
MYPEYARNTSTTWVVGRRTSDFTIDPAHALDVVAENAPSVVLLASPNNPTGTALPLDLVTKLHDAAPHALIVVDEAYAEFRRPGVPSALTLLDSMPRLAVTRTMSKAFASAGVRLGYVAGSAELVDALRVVRLPYHLSAVTQAVARVALRYADELLGRVAELRETRDELVAWLRSQGLSAAESDANFVLFGTFADRHAVWSGLVDRGVLVRETGPEGWLRVSVGTPDEMRAFRDALLEVT